jgi:hypothetical protein
VDELQAWEADRGKLDELDELDKPKDALPCIETEDYVALAGSGFPAPDVYAVGKSYGCGSFMSTSDGSSFDHLTSFSFGRRDASGLGTTRSA